MSSLTVCPTFIKPTVRYLPARDNFSLQELNKANVPWEKRATYILTKSFSHLTLVDKWYEYVISSVLIDACTHESHHCIVTFLKFGIDAIIHEWLLSTLIVISRRTIVGCAFTRNNRTWWSNWNLTVFLKAIGIRHISRNRSLNQNIYLSGCFPRCWTCFVSLKVTSFMSTPSDCQTSTTSRSIRGLLTYNHRKKKYIYIYTKKNEFYILAYPSVQRHADCPRKISCIYVVSG